MAGEWASRRVGRFWGRVSSPGSQNSLWRSLLKVKSCHSSAAIQTVGEGTDGFARGGRRRRSEFLRLDCWRDQRPLRRTDREVSEKIGRRRFRNRSSQRAAKNLRLQVTVFWHPAGLSRRSANVIQRTEQAFFKLLNFLQSFGLGRWGHL